MIIGMTDIILVLDRDNSRVYLEDILRLVGRYCTRTRTNPSDVLGEMKERTTILGLDNNECRGFVIMSCDNEAFYIHRAYSERPFMSKLWILEIAKRISPRVLRTDIYKEALTPSIRRLLSILGLKNRSTIFELETTNDRSKTTVKADY